MNLRRLLLAALAVGTLGGLLLAAPASAADPINIDHVQVDEDGTVDLVVATDGLPPHVRVDHDSVQVTVDGSDVQADAKPFTEDEQVSRSTVLALDTSLSMRGSRFEAAKQAARAFVEKAPDDVQIGLLTFSGSVHTSVAPTSDRAKLTDAIDDIELTYGTNLYDALVEAVALTGDEGARSVLVLSDGKDAGTSTTSLADAVDAAKDNGVVVDAVALEQGAQARSRLREITEQSGGDLVRADDPAALEELFAKQAESYNQQLLVQFPRPPAAPMEAQIEVSLTAGGKTYSDSALAQLGVSPNSVPIPVQTDPPLLGQAGLLVGAVALGIGLFGLLAIGLVSVSSERSQLVRRQIAFYASGGVAAPAEPARRSRSTEPSPSVRASMLALTERAITPDFETRLAQHLTGAGVGLTAAEWLLTHAGITVLAGLIGYVAGGPAGLVLLLFLGAALPWLFLRLRHGRRLATFHAQLAETLQLISGGLAAGLSLPQSVDAVVREGQDPMAAEMRRALIEHRLGVPMEDALDGVAERMDSDDFRWTAMAMRIQRGVGGNLSELLNTIAATLREREFLRRQVKVLSAEGRMSAWILTGLPVLFLVYVSLTQPDYLRPMYTTSIGLAMSLAFVVLLAAGVWAMSRLIKVEV